MRKAPAVAVLALLLSSCSSTGSTAPASATPAKTVAPRQAGTSSQKPPTEPGHVDIGATIELNPTSGPLDVTVLKVVEPAKPANPQIRPAAGQRWIGVEFRFVNKGSSGFDDNLYTLAGLDSQNRTLHINIDAEISAGPTIALLSGLHLAPGDSQAGFVVFEVPNGTELARVQYSPVGAGVARWAVG